MEKTKPLALLFRVIVPVACAISLTCYLIFSNALEFLFSGWDYHIKLFKMIFPEGFIGGLSQHLLSLINISTWHNGLLPLAFLSICVVTAWLCHSLLRGRRSDFIPHIILFSMAAAVVPTLLLAMFFWPDGRGKLTLDMTFYASLFIAIVLAVLKIVLFKWKKRHIVKTKYKSREIIGWGWVFILSLLVMFGLAFLNGYILVVGYDALAYHLPLAASWFHDAGITRGTNLQFYYPSNAELILRWGLVDGSERFVFLLSFCSAILCIYMLFKLGRAMGQTKQSATIAACCAATVPMIPFLATTAYTDTIGILFLLLSVFFLVRWIQSNLKVESHLVCAGLAGGLAAGSKLSMLSPVLAISIIAIFAALRSREIWRIAGPHIEDIKVNWIWLFSRAGRFFSAALLGGGYWYLRNLIEQGNPFYPVSVLGLSGFELKTLLPVHPDYNIESFSRFLYPWTEPLYTCDEGIGAVTTGIVIPAFLLWPLLHSRAKGIKLAISKTVYSIAWISLLLFILSGTMWMRYAIFPILVCVLFIGDICKKDTSIYLKPMVFAAFMFMTIAITHYLAGGYLYGYIRNSETRAEKLNVPEIVDILPPARIFNAAGAAHTYSLMGRDYRHEIITLYREVKPEDVLTYKPTHILLRKAQIEIFQTILTLEPVGTETSGANPVSLWKIIYTKQGIS